MVTYSKPNTYDHTKKSAISLTNELVCQQTLIKEEDATRVEDKKGNMMVVP